MFIKPIDPNATNVWDLSDEIMIYPNNEDVPCPWDADIDVNNGVVTLSGNLGPSGPANTACVCTCKIADFPRYYKLEVPDNTELQGTGWTKA